MTGKKETNQVLYRSIYIYICIQDTGPDKGQIIWIFVSVIYRYVVNMVPKWLS